ncbi:MAG: T9SS type A sorting domain-containing protein [Bacteroidetes bacterium]|nr:T9SS type A sorting domain-containing protein [Bacteroidota bacterium]
MKKLLLFSAIFILSQQSFGQGFQYVGVSPNPPTDTDTVSVIGSYVFTSGPCAVVNQNFTMTGNNIITNHYHCPGMLTVMCPGIDTLPIGVLAVGTYNVTANLFQGTYDSLGNCSEFLKIDSADFQFTVSLGTGVDLITKAKPIVFLNKENIRISNLTNEFQFVLYDVSGKEIISKKVSSTENIFSISVEAGVYFYSLQSNGRQEYTGKLVVNN